MDRSLAWPGRVSAAAASARALRRRMIRLREPQAGTPTRPSRRGRCDAAREGARLPVPNAPATPLRAQGQPPALGILTGIAVSLALWAAVIAAALMMSS